MPVLDAVFPALLSTGLLDPRVERARALIDTVLVSPYVVVDSEGLKKVYPRPDMSRPAKRDYSRVEGLVDWRRPSNDRTIYINRDARAYREGGARLAAVLAHENVHASTGDQDERLPRNEELLTLRRLGQGSSAYARLIAEMLNLK